MVSTTPVENHKMVKPNFSATKVPKEGVIMKDSENAMPKSPIYAPLLCVPERSEVIVAINGKAQISPKLSKEIEATNNQSEFPAANIAKATAQKRVPKSMVVFSFKYLSAICTIIISITTTIIPLKPKI